MLLLFVPSAALTAEEPERRLFRLISDKKKAPVTPDNRKNRRLPGVYITLAQPRAGNLLNYTIA